MPSTELFESVVGKVCRLLEPEDFDFIIRYVGYTHTSLKQRGLKPIIELIEETNRPRQCEVDWIEEHKRDGHPLLNMNNGGNGPLTHSLVTRKKISSNMLGKKFRRSPCLSLQQPRSREFREAVSRAMRGKLWTFEHRQSLTPLTRQRLSDAGRKGAHIALSHKGV